MGSFVVINFSSSNILEDEKNKVDVEKKEIRKKRVTFVIER